MIGLIGHYKAQQIIQATGWDAWWRDDDGKLDNAPVALWMLGTCQEFICPTKEHNEEGEQSLVGLSYSDIGLIVCEDDNSFLGYTPSGSRDNAEELWSEK